ncbi:ISAs1 family transposase [Trichormus azollae]|uniref:ISAs1 family transposase n=1 Tax=Trichormus azollae TaxID=1164 RepID=UPI00325DD07C
MNILLYLELTSGILSQNTFARLLAQLNTQRFQSCFLNWMKTVQSKTEGDVMAIDGKTLCGSHDQSIKQSPIQIVSVWATTNKLVLGQVKVDSKSNQITTTPELIKVLELNNCMVTIDAIGYQKEMVKLMTEQNADYVILKKRLR